MTSATSSDTFADPFTYAMESQWFHRLREVGFRCMFEAHPALKGRTPLTFVNERKTARINVYRHNHKVRFCVGRVRDAKVWSVQWPAESGINWASKWDASDASGTFDLWPDVAFFYAKMVVDIINQMELFKDMADLFDRLGGVAHQCNRHHTLHVYGEA